MSNFQHRGLSGEGEPGRRPDSEVSGLFSVWQECPGLQPRSSDSLPDLGVWVGVHSVRPGSGEMPVGDGREHRTPFSSLELAGCG